VDQWKTQDQLDIETNVGKHGIQEICFEDHIRDRSILQLVLSHLSNNKTPSPDEILNELRHPRRHVKRHAPATHTDHDVDDKHPWKQSEAILLHKNNDETLSKNY